HLIDSRPLSAEEVSVHAIEEQAVDDPVKRTKSIEAGRRQGQIAQPTGQRTVLPVFEGHRHISVASRLQDVPQQDVVDLFQQQVWVSSGKQRLDIRVAIEPLVDRNHFAVQASVVSRARDHEKRRHHLEHDRGKMRDGREAIMAEEVATRTDGMKHPRRIPKQIAASHLAKRWVLSKQVRMQYGVVDNLGFSATVIPKPCDEVAVATEPDDFETLATSGGSSREVLDSREIGTRVLAKDDVVEARLADVERQRTKVLRQTPSGIEHRRRFSWQRVRWNDRRGHQQGDRHRRPYRPVVENCSSSCEKANVAAGRT